MQGRGGKDRGRLQAGAYLCRIGEGGGEGGRRKKGARKGEKKEKGGKGRGEEERYFPKDIMRRTNVAQIGAQASEGGREG